MPSERSQSGFKLYSQLLPRITLRRSDLFRACFIVSLASYAVSMGWYVQGEPAEAPVTASREASDPKRDVCIQSIMRLVPTSYQPSNPRARTSIEESFRLAQASERHIIVAGQTGSGRSTAIQRWANENTLKKGQVVVLKWQALVRAKAVQGDLNTQTSPAQRLQRAIEYARKEASLAYHEVLYVVIEDAEDLFSIRGGSEAAALKQVAKDEIIGALIELTMGNTRFVMETARARVPEGLEIDSRDAAIIPVSEFSAEERQLAVLKFIRDLNSKSTQGRFPETLNFAKMALILGVNINSLSPIDGAKQLLLEAQAQFAAFNTDSPALRILADFADDLKDVAKDPAVKNSPLGQRIQSRLAEIEAQMKALETRQQAQAKEGGEIIKLESEIARVGREIERAQRDGNLAVISAKQTEKSTLETQLNAAEARYQSAIDPDSATGESRIFYYARINEQFLRETAARIRGLDSSQLQNRTMHERLRSLEEDLKKDVLDQDDVIRDVVKVIRLRLTENSAASTQQKPAIFLFAGPSGTGKTFLAETLLKWLYDGDSRALLKITGAEIGERHAARTIMSGSPPGYVAYEEGGRMANFAKEMTDFFEKLGIILVDEFEKGHEAFQQSLLSVADKGEITNNDGKVYQFFGQIILTSNAASQKIKELIDRDGRITDAGRGELFETLLQGFQVGDEIKKLLPEFFNRIDIMVFQPIEQKNELIAKTVRNFGQRKIFRESGIEVSVSKEVIAIAQQYAWSEQFQGRGVDRWIDEYLADAASLALLDGTLRGQGDRSVASKVEIKVDKANANRVLMYIDGTLYRELFTVDPQNPPLIKEEKAFQALAKKRREEERADARRLNEKARLEKEEQAAEGAQAQVTRAPTEPSAAPR